MTEPLHLAHLINPVKAPVYTELNYVQPITFESMRLAAKQALPDVRVDLLTTQFPEDHEIIPDYFIKTQDLEQSILDYGLFPRQKKFPLLRDLISRLYESTEAPYLIYTNVDIGLQPYFYNEVANRIRSGLDAFIINRRRIPARFTKIEELPQILSLPGEPHPGFDCFVFHRSIYPKFKFENVCIGIPYIEMAFSQNLFCYANNFQLFDSDYLTFHIGMEIFKKRDKAYLEHNKREFWKVIDKMDADLDSRKFPWGQRNLFNRMIRWGLHPAIPIRLALKLERRRWL
jgi:hypothetical protein